MVRRPSRHPAGCGYPRHLENPPRRNALALKLCTQKLIALDSDLITHVIGPFRDSVGQKAARTWPWRPSKIILSYQRYARKLSTVLPPAAATMCMLAQKFAECEKRQTPSAVGNAKTETSS